MNRSPASLGAGGCRIGMAVLLLSLLARPALSAPALAAAAQGVAAQGAATPTAGVTAATAMAPRWWVQLRSTAYAFQTADASGRVLDRLAGLQHLSAAVSGLWGGRVGLRVSGRFADDLSLRQRVFDRERLLVLYAQLAYGARGGRLRLGRQFVQEGTTQVTLDGLWASVPLSRRLQLRVWGGARTPTSFRFGAANPSAETVAGLRLVARPLRRLRLAGSFAYRERRSRVAGRAVGLEAGATPAPGLRLRLRGGYDLEQELWNRVELLGRWTPARRLPSLTLQLLDRRPAIDPASWFARFSRISRIRIGRAAIHYAGRRGFGLELESFVSAVDDASSSRLAAAALLPFGRVGYAARLGDAGEEDRWYGDVHLEPRSWLRLEAGAVVSTYALQKDAPSADERDLTTAFARAQATLRTGLRVTAELQSLDTPLASQDVRFLLGVDLWSGSGPVPLGWQRGG